MLLRDLLLGLGHQALEPVLERAVGLHVVGKEKSDKKTIQDPSTKFRYYHMDLTKGNHGECLLKRIGKRAKVGGGKEVRGKEVRGSQGQSYEE